jgi:hypothetical protein
MNWEIQPSPGSHWRSYQSNGISNGTPAARLSYPKSAKDPTGRGGVKLSYQLVGWVYAGRYVVIFDVHNTLNTSGTEIPSRDKRRVVLNWDGCIPY